MAAQPHGRFGVGAGPRLLLLSGVGLAWIIPALWNRTFLFAMLVWDGILLLAFVGDWLRLPHPKQLTLRRECRSTLSIGPAAALNLSGANQSSADVCVNAYHHRPAAECHTNR